MDSAGGHVESSREGRVVGGGRVGTELRPGWIAKAPGCSGRVEVFTQDGLALCKKRGGHSC